MIIFDYIKAEDCRNPHSLSDICLKCGSCGRIFENGIMRITRGITPEEVIWEDD